MVNDFEYIGLFLTPSSRESLMGSIPSIVGQRVFLDHCTLLHKSNIADPMAESVLGCFEEHQGEEFCITITHIGWNEKALAFRCCPSWLPYVNKQPHITIATFGNGKPVNSNSITMWIKLEKFIVKATLEKR